MLRVARRTSCNGRKKDLRMIVDETSGKEIAAIREIVNCISVRGWRGTQKRFNQVRGMASFVSSVPMELRLEYLISKNIYLLFCFEKL